MKSSRSPRPWLGALFVLLLLAPFVRSARHSALFIDEAGFIWAGDGVVSLLLNGNMSPEAWRSNEWNDYGWMNPQLGKVIMGLAIRVGAPRTFTNVDGKRRLEITPRVLLSARTPAVLFAVGSCVMMFLIGARISPAVGALAALVAAFNRYYRYTVSLALLEAPAAFFSLLAVLLMLRLHDALENEALAKHVPRRAAVLGVALGLALASKYLCGMLLLFVLLYLAVAAARRAVRQKLVTGGGRRLLAATILVVSLASATFFVLTPQFYDRPIAMYRQTMRAWSERWAGQRRDAPQFRVDDLTHSIELTLGALLFNTTSQGIVDVLSIHIRRVGLRTVARSYVTSAFNIESLCVLLAVGVIAACRWRAGSEPGWTEQELVLAWLLWTIAIFAVWLPLSFHRYFMYPFLPTPILIGFGAVEAFRRLRG